MLFVPITWRANFCARKFISFVAFEHEKMPNDVEASAARAAAKPDAARSSASSQLAGRKAPPSRTSGVVRRPRGGGDHLASACEAPSSGGALS